MAIATPVGTARAREDLRDAWAEFDPSLAGFIARILFPAYGVKRRKGTIKTIPREAYLQLIDTKRTAGSKTSTSSWSIEEDSYILPQYAHMSTIDAIDELDYDEIIDLEEQEMIRIHRTIESDLERDAAAIAFSSTLFPLTGTTGITLSNPWSDKANGTPLDDIATAIDYIESASGVEPNALVITKKAYLRLSLHPDVRAGLTENFGRIKPGMVPQDNLAVILGVERVLVAGAGTVYNSASPGAEPVLANIWNTDRALLTRIESGRLMDGPQLGRLLSIDGKGGLTIESTDQFDPPSRLVRAQEYMAIKPHPTPVGYLFAGVL